MLHEQTTQWAGGTTRQIYISPDDATLQERNFDLRISSATINLTESRFSDFSGFTRYIMPLEGEIELHFADRTVRLEHGKLYQFSGSEEVTSTNTQGAVDFNIIVANGIETDIRIINSSNAPAESIVFALEDIEINGTLLPRHAAYKLESPASIPGKAVLTKIK